MWLNYLPIAGEGLYVHHWIIRRAQSSDLAGFKVTIALSYSWGSSCQEVFLTHVQFSLSERFIFEEANKAVFMEGVAVFFVWVFFFPFFWCSFTPLSTDLTQVRRVATAHQGFGTEVLTDSLPLFFWRNSCVCLLPPICQTHPIVKDLLWLIWFCFGVHFNSKPQTVTQLYTHRKELWNFISQTKKER